jgi:hypothetical protein
MLLSSAMIAKRFVRTAYTPSVTSLLLKMAL